MRCGKFVSRGVCFFYFSLFLFGAILFGARTKSVLNGFFRIFFFFLQYGIERNITEKGGRGKLKLNDISLYSK